MASINDTHGVLGDIKTERTRVQQAAEDGLMDPRDRDAILTFVTVREGDDNLSPHTIYDDIAKLRLSAVRADIPLVDIDPNGVLALKKTLQSEYGVTSGIENYKRVLRLFLRDHLGHEWADDLTSLAFTQHRDNGYYDPADALTEDDITTLLEAAHDSRDRALIAFLAYTGARIGLTLSLRVRDLDDIDTDMATFRPNPGSINNKDIAQHRFPLNEATLYVRRFLHEDHPHPRDADNWPDAPVFPLKHDYDPDQPDQSALGGRGAQNVLSRTTARTDISKPTNAHNFRHSLVTRMLASGDFDTTDFRFQFGWKPGSIEAMIDYYQGLTDDERLKRLWRRHGLVIPDEDTEYRIRTCRTCGHEVPRNANYCPVCATAVSATATARDEAIHTPEEADAAVMKLARFLNDHPEVEDLLTED